MKRFVSGFALISFAFALVACGTSDEPEPNVAGRQASGSEAIVCPNNRSNTAALKVSNRLDAEVFFTVSPSLLNCNQWSETGNPTRYTGRVIGESGATGKEHISDPVWGLQPAAGTAPVFFVRFQGQGVAGEQFAVKVKMEVRGDGVPAPSEILVGDGFGQWGTSVTAGTVNGKTFSAYAPGVVQNPNDGSWDINGSQNSKSAWLLSIAYPR